jgi:prevent-host-death family protein
MKVNIRQTRENLSSILHRVEEGEEVEIYRRNTEIARIVPSRNKKNKLAGLESFRNSLKVSGKPLSHVVIEDREKERY